MAKLAHITDWPPRRCGRLACVALAVVAALIGTSPAPSASAATCASATTRPSATLCLVNAERQSHGLSTLRLDPRLSRAAREHSRDMVRRRYFSHTTPDGVTFVHRIRAAGYLSSARRWLVGENLAWGWGRQGSAQRVVRSWMHSPPHRREILTPAFRDVGIGIVAGVPRPLPRGGATYTVDFGVRR